MAAIALSVQSLRSLKNALQDRFPTIKSSHMSEALASALGFRTYAALLAKVTERIPATLHPLVEERFVERLNRLGYPGIQAFSFDEFISGVPEEFQQLIKRLLKLEEKPEGRWDEIYLLRHRCATLFATAFGIGFPASREDDDKKMVKRLSRGVDHKAAMPGWGSVVNVHRESIDFPGADHQVRFYERLPLAHGKFVEYSTALVSMPYTQSFRMAELPKARELAARIGWECIELKEWTWYAAERTTLVLFRRTTSHDETLRVWNGSFKRWLVENKSRLMKGGSENRRRVVESAVDCPNVPLDVETWGDLRERYLKEFAPHLYFDEQGTMTRAFQRLFEKWLAERGDAEVLAA